MKRPHFDALIAFKADLEARAAVLRERESELNQELAALNAAYDENAVQGLAEETQDKIDELIRKLALIQRELHALERPPHDGKMGQLTKAAWEETSDLVMGPCREKWNALQAETEAAKKVFLDVVRRLGEVKRKADRLSSSMTEVILSSPGPKLVCPYLTTGIVEHRQAGIIYISAAESDSAFKKGA